MFAFSNLKTTSVLGINIVHLRQNDLADFLRSLFETGKFHHLVSANPEILLTARCQPEYQEILRKAEACLSDGFGVVLMSWLIRPRIPERITGVEVVKKLLTLVEANSWSVFILLPQDGLTSPEKLQTVLKQFYPNLIFTVSDDENDPRAREKDIVLCALGHPMQEKWIAGLRGTSQAKIAVGVGGALDFLTGSIQWAPRLVRALGLEWLWRLILEPRRRWRRIFRAVIIFPLTVFYDYARKRN